MAWRIIGIGRCMGAVAVLAVGSATGLSGQVGISSSVAQVALIARAVPLVTLHAVGRPRQTERRGNLRSAVVSLHFSANSAHRLIVRNTSTEDSSRVWVRVVDGTYAELVPGAVLRIARSGGSTRVIEREISYRIESNSENAELELPVRYEIAVDPTL